MFFSVKNPMIIGGKKYRTCICYPVTEYVKKTVEELAQKGKVDLYDEVRFFCNGKLMKTKAEEEAEKKEIKKAERKAKRSETKEVLEVKEVETEGF